MRKSFKGKLFLIFFLTLWGQKLTGLAVTPAQFVVWNVGQGLWTTWIQPQECWHFDLGGEKKSVVVIVAKSCAGKLNRLFFSHWDLDHINYLPELRRRHWNLCLAVAPGGVGSPRKQSWFEGLPACPENQDQVLVIWDQRRESNVRSNEASNVFEIPKIRWVIPGDSTRGEEKKWLSRSSESIRGLVLGHHGSQTSSSEQLLRHLPQLRFAVASARRSRYGHPHREVVVRLRQKKIPLLRTEEWGHLRFIE